MKPQEKNSNLNVENPKLINGLKKAKSAIHWWTIMFAGFFTVCLVWRPSDDRNTVGWVFIILMMIGSIFSDFVRGYEE